MSEFDPEGRLAHNLYRKPRKVYTQTQMTSDGGHGSHPSKPREMETCHMMSQRKVGQGQGVRF